MRRLLVLTGVMILAIAACGVPDRSDFEAINSKDIPFHLADPSTTTTTTTLAPSTVAPSTTAAVSTSTTTIPPTSSTLATEGVDLYFAAGSQLTPVLVQLAPRAQAPQVLAALSDGPLPGDVGGRGLRAVMRRGARLTVEVRGGVANVDLPADVFDGLSPSDQRLVFGQIVLTLSNRPGIGQVSFTQAGVPIRAYLGNGQLSEPGGAVAADSYTQLLAGGTAPPPVTTTTTTTIVESTSTTATSIPGEPGSTTPGGKAFEAETTVPSP
jgi:hypothetical protein